jgi:hypothetical protein
VEVDYPRRRPGAACRRCAGEGRREGAAFCNGPLATYKAPAAQPATATKKLVNLNAATAKELKGLPGGSDEEAARIIAGRPYNSKALLVTNKVISEGRYGESKLWS